VYNTSVVPLTYHCYVSDDGESSPVCYDCYNVICSSDDNPTDNSDDVYHNSQSDDRVVMDSQQSVVMPREFTIEPQSGELGPMSGVTITVHFCPNYVTSYVKMLTVGVTEVDEQSITLPINATYVVY